MEDKTQARYTGEIDSSKSRVLAEKHSHAVNIFKKIHIMKALMIFIGLFPRKSLSVLIDTVLKFNIGIAFSVILPLLVSNRTGN